MSSGLETPGPIKTAEQIRKELDKVSPLALTQKLIGYEIVDMQSSLEILDGVYREFEGDDNVLARFAEPVTLAVIDAGIRCIGAKSETKNTGTKEKPKPQSKDNPARTSGGAGEDCQKKYGLSAQKIWREIKGFKYSLEDIEEYSYKPSAAHHSMRDSVYVRTIIDDADKRNEYKKAYFNDGNRRCEYDEKTEMNFPKEYYNKEEREKLDPRRDRRRSAATDHIVPLEQFHNWTDSLSKHLSENDKKRIVNQKSNYSVVNTSLNSSKGSKSNKEWLEEKGAKGKVAENMAKMQEEAETALKKDIALTAAKNATLSELIPIMLVPLGFEIYDMTTRGFCHGLATENPVEAITLRIKRACGHIIKRIPNVLNNLLHSVVDLVVTAVANLFKKASRLVVEGFSLLVEALRVLAPPHNKATTAQKWDAISKILAGPVAALVTDVALDTLLNQLGIVTPFSEIVSAVVAAIVSTGILYLLEKLDLFSTKSELRLARVREIFDARILAIKESTKNFDIATHEILKAQRVQFETLRSSLDSALKSKNMRVLNDTIDNVADFLKVDIPYSTPQEFLRFIRENDRIAIGS